MDLATPLDRRRMVAAWMTVGVLVLTFMPTPIRLAEPPPRFEGEVIPVSSPAPRPPARRGGLVVVWPFTWRPRAAEKGVRT
jgi:hypothetical protein